MTMTSVPTAIEKAKNAPIAMISATGTIDSTDTPDPRGSVTREVSALGVHKSTILQSRRIRCGRFDWLYDLHL
jgi:hypothetical protein